MEERALRKISIHVPRVEDDPKYSLSEKACRDFNPRPPCGGRPALVPEDRFDATFQSTSPVWRTTEKARGPRPVDENFNPRPPCGGRLDDWAESNGARIISIHVPRVEDDCRHGDLSSEDWQFQSTSPVWRTTHGRRPPTAVFYISIHVPRVEDDRATPANTVWSSNFNPRPPCGGRQE